MVALTGLFLFLWYLFFQYCFFRSLTNYPSHSALSMNLCGSLLWTTSLFTQTERPDMLPIGRTYPHYCLLGPFWMELWCSTSLLLSYNHLLSQSIYEPSSGFYLLHSLVINVSWRSDVSTTVVGDMKYGTPGLQLTFPSELNPKPAYLGHYNKIP